MAGGIAGPETDMTYCTKRQEDASIKPEHHVQGGRLRQETVRTVRGRTECLNDP